MSSNYMTKETYEKLKKKLEYLKNVRRPQLAKIVGEAREHGDLRENSAYHAAKEEQGLNEMKIRELEEQLANAVIVTAEELPESDVVTINSRVRIKALDTEQEMEYTIVPEGEADVLEGKISPASPVGAALLSHRKGDVVEVEAPRGLIKYQILEISR